MAPAHLFERFRGLLPPDRLLANAPLKDYTTFRIGGPADVLARPSTYEEVRLLLAVARSAGVPIYILGNGSNTLVRDKGFRGLVIHIHKPFSGIRRQDNTLFAQGGIQLSELAATAAREGLAGLEFASGIPGCLGGAVYMNAGAYTGEMAHCVRKVLIVNSAMELAELTQADMGFSYRHTALTGKNCVILEAELALLPDEPFAITERIADFTRRRKARQPLQFPSAGSMFKRPKEGYAAAMIDEAGLKGLAVGDAEVSAMHAGFFINRGQATAADVLALVEKVQEAVSRRFGVSLEPEVTIIGEE